MGKQLEYNKSAFGSNALEQGSPNYGPRSHFVNDEKNVEKINCEMCLRKKFADLVECNISRINHITYNEAACLRT